MTTVRNVRVGFILYPGHWMGGKIYMRNLIAALRTIPDNPITPVIFSGQSQASAFPDFPDVEIVTSSMLDGKTSAWFARKVVAKAMSQDVLLCRLLQKHSISVLSHSSHLGRQTAVKTVGWIPDFQHIHLPEFFTPEERIQRDREFRGVCMHCNKVIVSSECARADLARFSPEYAGKAKLLRFVANPMPDSGVVTLPELQKTYGFSGQYFLLPNQFWAHKNHRVVISALHQLKRSGRSFLVLATGSQTDYRNPSFFPTLVQYAADCDVQDCFRVLGQIPFEHLAGLMSHAVAFINPSKFEGWSTSVEEAKSMGKQIVLSDIPVHREQAPERGFFFPPEEPEGLVQAMVCAYEAFDQQEDATMQAKARAYSFQRLREFGDAYRRIVDLALS